jgi:hypothetical protein
VIRTYRRPAEPRDLRALTRGKGSLVRNVLFVTLPLTALASGVTYAITRSWAAAAAVAAALFAASAVSNVRFFRDVARRQGQAADARAVEVMEVEAGRVLDIEPLGSHGPALVFFVGDGQAVLLIGQWLLEQRAFPAAAFRLHRWADTGKPIRIESTGPRVTPEHSNATLPSDRISDVELLQASPETLQADLDRAFGGR